MTKPMSGTVPDDVRRLLFDCIESYEQLELLLILEKSRGTAMGTEELGALARVHESLIEDALHALGRRGLIAVQDPPQAPGALPEKSTTGKARRFLYEPASAGVDGAVRLLARWYAEEPQLIIRLMSEHSIQRVRAGAAIAFADAFLLKKDRSDG